MARKEKIILGNDLKKLWDELEADGCIIPEEVRSMVGYVKVDPGPEGDEFYCMGFMARKTGEIEEFDDDYLPWESIVPPDEEYVSPECPPGLPFSEEVTE